MAAAGGTVRLYVGGLPREIGDDEVAARFAPFGTVSQVELAPEKGECQASSVSRCRGFGHVSFTPKDDKSLSRCLSLYNGCVWRGRKLRVERALPDFKERLQAEWTAEAEELAASQDGTAEGEEAEVAASSVPPAPKDAMLSIAMGGAGSKVVSVPLTPAHTPLTHKKYFPPMKSNLSVASLSWEAPEHSYSQREMLLIGASNQRRTEGHVEATVGASPVTGNREDATEGKAGSLSPSSAPVSASDGRLKSKHKETPSMALFQGMPVGNTNGGGDKQTRAESETKLINRTAYVSLHGGGGERHSRVDKTAGGRGRHEVVQLQTGEPQGGKKRLKTTLEKDMKCGTLFRSGYESESTSEDYSELRRLAANQRVVAGTQDEDTEFEVVNQDDGSECEEEG